MIGGKTWTYQYGADGLRRRTTVEESGQPTKVTDYVLDGQSVVREFRNEGPWATYLIGARGVEYRQDDTQTGTPRLWNVYDGLGSVLATVNEAGVVQEARVVDVYGNPRDGGGPLTGNWFVGGLGHTYDDDPTGLIYMRARWYDPVTGRFISEDPAGNGTNWYVYASGNPVNRRDRNGTSDDVPDVSEAFFLLGGALTAMAIAIAWRSWTIKGCTAAAAFAGAAIIAFGTASVGICDTTVYSYLSQGFAAAGLGAEVYAIVATSAVGLKTIAGVAIAAALFHSFMLYGMILSIGAENATEPGASVMGTGLPY